MSVFIQIFDDDVDETDEQDFKVHLYVIDASNHSLIQITTSTALCYIIDNDGK